MKDVNKASAIPLHYEFVNRGYYTKPLFDPIQTHAVYGLNESDISEVKEYLKRSGATRLRVVKARHGFRIICYKGI